MSMKMWAEIQSLQKRVAMLEASLGAALEEIGQLSKLVLAMADRRNPKVKAAAQAFEEATGRVVAEEPESPEAA